MSRPPLRWSWLGALVVIIVCLVIAATGDRGPASAEERLQDLADSLACPACSGESIGESNVPIAREIRAEMRRLIDEGQSDEEIRDYLVGIFDEDIDYTPSASGVTGLVWILPPVAAAAAVAGLAVAFRRWRQSPATEVADADRAIVAAALADRHE